MNSYGKGTLLRLREMKPHRALQIIRAKAKGVISDRVTVNSLRRIIEVEVTDDGMLKLGNRIIGKVG